MDSKLQVKRIASLALLAALFIPILIGPPPAAAQTPEPLKIGFSYSHGEYKAGIAPLDNLLSANLTRLGYETVWAKGGINSTFLSDLDGLVLTSIYGATSGYLQAERDAIAAWFATGNKFIWVAYDSDYHGGANDGQFINDNMTAILEAVKSHVYGEPTAVQDPISNCAAAYRPVANGTSTNAFVASIVHNVTKVLMHGPTLLYGSNSANPGENVAPVALETVNIPNVYPLLYYGGNATIVDSDTLNPYAHTAGAKGAFVAMTIEINAGSSGNGVIVVSGASPYGDYQPMYSHQYYGVTLDGYYLVLQTIDFGLKYATNPPVDMTLLYVGIGVGAVVVIVIIVALMKKK
ncbi:MAG: hypothetical protein HXY34_11940 [Candidatus Thorarchaeota archaeon]|nr:hypothetical protein [Candidatus Thorarchaeota archaeon]